MGQRDFNINDNNQSYPQAADSRQVVPDKLDKKLLKNCGLALKLYLERMEEEGGEPIFLTGWGGRGIHLGGFLRTSRETLHVSWASELDVVVFIQKH